MATRERATGAVEVSVDSIGGIDETEVTLREGVNVLAGRNATNRTSFLQALMAALGSEDVSLKGDADEGRVELRIGGETYTRTLRRRGGGVAFDGNPYLDDPGVADSFAFLLETNPARRAVARGDDLREVIMQPVDTDEIERQIESLTDERRQIDDRIERIQSRKERLPDLEERRRSLEEEIAEKREALDEVEADIAEAEADPEAKREEQAELEEALEDLNDARSELQDVQYDLDTEREALETAREELAEVEAEREDLPDAPAEELAALDDRIERLREEKRDLDAVVTKLQNIVQFNEEMLSGDGGLRELLDGDDDEESGDVTAQLLPGGATTVCWTCGSEVEADAIDEMLERLRELSREKRAERSEVTDELDELTRERRELEDVQDSRQRLERRRERLEDEIAEREESVEALTGRREDLEERVADLEERAETLEGGDDSDVLELHKRANQLELELSRLTDDLDGVESDVDDIEAAVEEADDLRERREEIGEELSDLRTRIERLETEAVEAFNEHMNNLLAALDYENLARIWIERTERESREGRRKVSRPVFDLHVVRTAESGATYEDSVDHLSESEREVTGLVFALAGYLVHEVYEEVPFMLLDSLEAIDSDRIATLVEYFEDYAPNIAVALLPEDAQALDESYHRVSEV